MAEVLGTRQVVVTDTTEEQTGVSRSLTCHSSITTNPMGGYYGRSATSSSNDYWRKTR